MKRTKIETTNEWNGMRIQGGICGRIVSYPAATIAEIMDCDEAEAADMDGDEMVPGCDGTTLRQYLNYHGYKGHVIRKGHEIF
jgi:hypothetical protein